LEFKKIIKTTDDNYVAVGSVDHSCIPGSTLQDIFISKIDALGNMLWYKTYGDEITDIGVDVKELLNGDLIIFAWYARIDTNFTPYTSFHLIKTNATGDSLWTRHYNHNDRAEQFASAVVETSDGGFALAGSVTDQNGGLKGYIIKTNNLGIEQWNTTIDSLSENYSELVSVFSYDGNFTVTGKIYGVAVENTIISNFNNSGSLNWTNTLDEGDVQIFSSTITRDGGYALTGETTDVSNPQPVIIRLDSNGNKLWRKNLTQLTQNYPGGIIQSMDNDLIITGNSVGFNPYSVFLTKTADSSAIQTAINTFALDKISVYPNPTAHLVNLNISGSDLLNIESIKMITIQGIVIKSFSRKDIRDGRIDISELSSGSYFAAIYNTGGRINILKIIKE
jgi:hypothetical protein